MKLELRSITKRFPGVVANDSIDLTVEPGEIHALLGENGAGKTTLMNIIYGLYQPNEGHILVDGKKVDFSGPGDAIATGIGMVHQHFMLIPVFTVAENIMLGNESTQQMGWLDLDQVHERIQRVSEIHNLEVEPNAVIEELPLGVRQRVEIIKALYRESKLLILDEPTAVLTPQESERLFDTMRDLKQAGVSIVFISHKLNEVLTVADRITVLRLGKVVGTVMPSQTSQHDLAAMMVGRSVELEIKKEPGIAKGPVLEIENLTVHNWRGQVALDRINLTVCAGEIVVIAGVQGNGQSELVETIMGLRECESGEVQINGQLVEPNPRRVLEEGVAHVPEDRLLSGLVAGFSVAKNLILNTYYQRPFSKYLNLSIEKIDKHAAHLVDEFDIRTQSTDSIIENLSGGNQQKVIVAREFSKPINLLVASQPTRGLDVGSIEYIHQRIIEKRDEGAAVLIVSTELDEVFALADRIAVLFGGEIVGVLNRDEATLEQVGLLMGGAKSAAEPQNTRHASIN